MKYTIVLVTLSSLAIIICAQNNEQLTVLSKQSMSCEEQGSCQGATMRESRCKSRNCLKRGVRQDDLGPFWANRGKKDPKYIEDRLYVDEPHWILVRRDYGGLYDPFFITRGKKMKEFQLAGSRNRRDRVKAEFLDNSPFYAARGKKHI